MLFDDFAKSPHAVIADAFALLGITEATAATVRHDNKGGVTWRGGIGRTIALNPRVTTVRRAVKQRMPSAYSSVRSLAQRRMMRPAESMLAEVQVELVSYFHDDVLRLGEMIGRDLSRWLDPYPVDAA